MKNGVTISSSTVAVVVERLWVGVDGKIVKEKESFFSAMESSKKERGLAINVAHTQQRSLSGSNVLAHLSAPDRSRQVQGRAFSIVLNSQCLFTLTLFPLRANKLHQFSHNVVLAVGDGDMQCSVTCLHYFGRVSLLVLLVRFHHFFPLAFHAKFEQTLACFLCVLPPSTIFPFRHHHITYSTLDHFFYSSLPQLYIYVCVECRWLLLFFGFHISYSIRKLRPHKYSHKKSYLTQVILILDNHLVLEKISFILLRKKKERK